MLVHLIVGAIVGIAAAASLAAHFCSSADVPPKGLARRWRAETSSPRWP